MDSTFIPEPGEVEGEDYFIYNCPLCNKEILFPDGTDELITALEDHLRSSHARFKPRQIEAAALRLLKANPFPESM